MGPDRLELSSFVVHSDLLAVEMDLPRSYKAAQVRGPDARYGRSDGHDSVRDAGRTHSAFACTKTARRR